MATELAVRDSVGGVEVDRGGAAPGGHGSTSVAQVQTIAAHFVKSGFFKDTRDLSQAVVKIMAGAEMGFGPFASMKGVDVIEGKAAISAGLIAAAVTRGGKYRYRIREHTEAACAIEFFEGRESLGISRFSMEDAQKAGLAGKQVWKQYPRNMLFARAMSNGARWMCADVFAGAVYTPEELGADVDEDGAIVQAAQPAPGIRMVDVITAEVAMREEPPDDRLTGGGGSRAAEPAQGNAERVKAELKARVADLQAAAEREGLQLPDVTKCGTVREVKQWIADAEKAIPEPF